MRSGALLFGVHLTLSTNQFAFGQSGGEWARGGPETLEMSLEGMRDKQTNVAATLAPCAVPRRDTLLAAIPSTEAASSSEFHSEFDHLKGAREPTQWDARSELLALFSVEA